MPGAPQKRSPLVGDFVCFILSVAAENMKHNVLDLSVETRILRRARRGGRSRVAGPRPAGVVDVYVHCIYLTKSKDGEILCWADVIFDRSIAKA